MVKGIETTYVDFTRKTAKYPKRREKEYLMIGLMNEAGEVGGAFKKEIRDHVDNTDLIIDEMGDVLWYLTRLCDVYDIKISELMIIDIKKLTVTTDNEREQWMELLNKASHYHYDMAGQFSPEILGDTEMEEVAEIHRAWGRAIQDAVSLIGMWEVESEQ